MGNATKHLNTLNQARVDFRWCARARLIDASEIGWREFLAGYVSMEEFFERHPLPQTVHGDVRASDVLTVLP